MLLRGEKTLQSFTFLGFVGETLEKQKPPKKKELQNKYPVYWYKTIATLGITSQIPLKAQIDGEDRHLDVG